MAQQLVTCTVCGRERTVSHMEEAVFVKYDHFGGVVDTTPSGAYRCSARTSCKVARREAARAL